MSARLPFLRLSCSRAQSYAHSSTPPSRRSFGSHVLAGVAGGSVVLAAGYTWYHFSGIKTTVDAAWQATSQLEQTQQALANKSPIQALQFLRHVAKSYVSFLPGAAYFVDKTFDAVDDAAAAHSDKAAASIAKAYSDISGLVSRDKEHRSPNTALEILEICRRLSNELAGIAADVGTPLMDKIKLELVSRKTTEFYHTAKSNSPDLKQTYQKVRKLYSKDETPATPASPAEESTQKEA